MYRDILSYIPFLTKDFLFTCFLFYLYLFYLKTARLIFSNSNDNSNVRYSIFLGLMCFKWSYLEVRSYLALFQSIVSALYHLTLCSNTYFLPSWHKLSYVKLYSLTLICFYSGIPYLTSSGLRKIDSYVKICYVILRHLNWYMFVFSCFPHGKCSVGIILPYFKIPWIYLKSYCI